MHLLLVNAISRTVEGARVRKSLPSSPQGYIWKEVDRGTFEAYRAGRDKAFTLSAGGVMAEAAPDLDRLKAVKLRQLRRDVRVVIQRLDKDGTLMIDFAKALIDDPSKQMTDIERLAKAGDIKEAAEAAIEAAGDEAAIEAVTWDFSRV